jgi:hypothetical protein
MVHTLPVVLVHEAMSMQIVEQTAFLPDKKRFRQVSACGGRFVCGKGPMAVGLL